MLKIRPSVSNKTSSKPNILPMPGEVNNKLRPSHSDYTGSNGHYINTISPTNKAKKSMPNKNDEIKTNQYSITDNSDDTDIVFIYIYLDKYIRSR